MDKQAGSTQDEPADRMPRTTAALAAVAKARETNPAKPWTHHDALIIAMASLECDYNELLAKVQAGERIVRRVA